MATTVPLMEELAMRPLLVQRNGEALFQACIQHLLSDSHANDMFAVDSASEDDFWPSADSWQAAYRPYVVKDGILQIPVMGVLLNRFSFQYGRWATGYTYIERALSRGLADANVKGIAFIHHSPGGEVAGCFELADKIYAGRKQKRMRSFAADACYSASYALGSSAHDLVVTRSGGVGSVGVVTAHVEWSKALEEMGVKVTFIFAGAHKVDGNPYEKLPASVKERIQDRIDKTYAVFTSTVARNRAMDDKAVRATEALTYDGKDAIEIGFADKLGSLDEELVIYSDECGHYGDDDMAQNNDTSTITQAMLDDAVAKATATAKAEGKAEGLKEGATTERTRISGILASDEGKKRPKAAMSLAMKTALSLEESTASLADMPEEKAEAPQGTQPTMFEQAMGTGNPDVGGGEDPAKVTGTNTSANLADSILGDYRAQTGAKKKAA